MHYDAIVVGGGHAGIEAALALSRTGFKTLVLSITLDNVGYLACNPSIGGTAKGHLVREIDALGGEMGVAADKNLTQLRMLNRSKGPAVQSLRAQIDKYKYHAYMKSVLENDKNIVLRQGEVKDLLVKDNKVLGLETVYGLKYYAKTVVLACGVYLKSTIIVGDVVEEKGPVCFNRSNFLSDSLKRLGIQIRRFKTGTPARVNLDTVDLSRLQVQQGEQDVYSFSAVTSGADKAKEVCYLGYTNESTHEIIRKNLHLSPKYSGLIHGVGARYCPSIEDKVVRFQDKPRHQFFLEPEGEGTKEMYVQGLSTGLPASVQLEFYRSVEGFENVEIMRDAYAIEYDCINPLELYPTLEHKKISGLFFAGQINGTSGYEEAAAQGIVAGINASLKMRGKAPMILQRHNSYIGVLIDDLVTAGADEPYRMMTSRSEYRLSLRQDNADLRLTAIGREVGLVGDNRFELFEKKIKDYEEAKIRAQKPLDMKKLNAFLESVGQSPAANGMNALALFKRNGVTKENFCAAFDTFEGLREDAVEQLFIETKYEGYLLRQDKARAESLRLSNMPLDVEDYSFISGLRLEAREKLNKIKPMSLGQASRISGVTPADINVLIIYLKQKS